MSARTPAEADAALRDRFQLWLSCVSRSIFIADHVRGHSTEERYLRLSARPVPLQGARRIAFHWHPAGRSAVHEPHLHLAGLGAQRLDTSRLHVPTGWVSLAAVLRFAVQDLGVRPLRSDWVSILAEPAIGPREF